MPANSSACHAAPMQNSRRLSLAHQPLWLLVLFMGEFDELPSALNLLVCIDY